MLKTFALRGPRGADHGLRPAGPRRPVRLAAPDLRPAHLPVRAGRAAARRGARPRRLPARDLPGRRTASRRSATRSSRRSGPGRFDVETADALGVPHGPERGALQRASRSRSPDGRVVAPEQVLGPARPGRTLVIAGDTAPSRDRGSRRPRGADVLVHEVDLPRGRAGPRPRDGALDRGRRPPRSHVRRGCGCSRSPTSRTATSGRKRRGRRAPIFPGTVVPRDFDIIEIPFQERGGPRLIKGGALPRRDDDDRRGESARGRGERR